MENVSPNKTPVNAMYGITVLNFISMSIFSPLINQQVQDFSATSFEMGIVASGYGIFTLISSPLMARWSTLYGSQQMFIFSLITTAIVNLIQCGTSIFIIFAVTRGVAGFFKHSMTLGKLVLVDFVTRDYIPRVFGKYYAFANIGVMLGPTIGGYLLQCKNGVILVFLTSGILYGIQIVIISTFVVRASAVKANLGNEHKEPTITTRPPKEWPFLKLFLTNSQLVAMLFAQFLFHFATQSIRANFPLIVTGKYGVSVTAIGYLNSIQSLVSCCTGFGMGTLFWIYKKQNSIMIIHSGTLLAISLFGIYLSPTYLLGAISILLLEVSTAILNVSIVALLLENCKEDTGMVLGFSKMVSAMTLMITPVISGYMQHLFSYNAPSVLGGCSAVFGVLTILYFSFHKRTNTKLD